MRIQLLAAAVLVAGGLAAAAPAAAVAAPTGLDRAQIEAQLGRQATSMRELQRQIDLQLQLAPDGEQTAVNEVSYDNGKFVVTYALPGMTVQASPDCESGWYCFYDHPSWGYPRGKLSACGWQDLDEFKWSDRVESVDNRTDKWVSYIEHYDAGNPANGHSLDYHLFYSAAHSARSTVPYPNRADHVNREC